MRINIETIPHEKQRYPTVGDYWEDNDELQQVRVSEMQDWRYEALVAVHELIEMILVKHRGISEESITEFDIAFEQSREVGRVLGEPGNDPRAPYQRTLFRDQRRAASRCRARRRLVCLRDAGGWPRHQEIVLEGSIFGDRQRGHWRIGLERRPSIVPFGRALIRIGQREHSPF